MAARKQKKGRFVTVLFTCLLVVTVLLVSTAAALYLSGRNAVTKQVVAPTLPVKPQTQQQSEKTPEEAQQEPEEKEAPVVLDAYTIEHNGKYYRYNEDMYNVLLLGIDSDRKPAQALPSGSDIQADALVLAALDFKNNDITLIALNRDTMCDFTILHDDGTAAGTDHGQLALSYAYGDGLQTSCELTADAVSGLFYGLQIHNYAAYFMGGVADLADAMGGVTVTVLENDFPFWHMGGVYSGMVPNAEVTLYGKQALMYLRARNETEDGNLMRMQRQKEFMLAIIQQALTTVKENPGSVIKLYDALDDYILTDLDIATIMFLATKAVSMSFSGDLITPQGDLIAEGNHMALYLNEDAMYDLMLDVFYEEVTP